MTHVNGDTPHQFTDEHGDGGALATERAEAQIRLEEARRDHAEKVQELNRITGAIRAKQRTIDNARADLVTLNEEHTVQNVRTEAARKRVLHAEDELATISKDRVRGPRSTKGKKA